MIRDIQLKVCGLRRPADAARAAALGADYLGFILYEKSPRHLALDAYLALAAEWPAGPRRVAVMVEPSVADLRAARAAGFHRFQIHARHDLPQPTVRAWTAEVGPENLWLAPKLPPDAAFPAAWLDCAHTFLVDTYHASGFGGSGRTGDWSGYAR
ncbi:MAG: phosphoribosylanthranilate isomerase, partial [Opitutaceae bacterium]|nr:phosphoribosylanthranilate isomerase [Opitutaceae bacterium]